MAKHSELEITAVLVCALALAGCGNSVKNAGTARGRDIICFGDSLTAGRGAAAGEDYPSALRRMAPRPVVNAGVSGQTSAEGLARLERDVLSKRPYMVIIEFGGNDFRCGEPFSATVANVEQMILAVQRAGAIAVVADTGGSVFLSRYSAEFARLARRRRAVFVPAIMGDIMDKPEYMSDAFHPNARGYRLIAEKIHKKTKKYF